MPFRLAGNLLFLSGVGPRRADETMMTGKVGADVTVEQGYEAAKLCGLNLLVNMIAAVGTLERVDTVLKVLGMVNAVPDFTRHPEVINGCTDLFVQVLGESGRPARSAVGMGSLPRNIAVEVEAIVLIKGRLTEPSLARSITGSSPGARMAQARGQCCHVERSLRPINRAHTLCQQYPWRVRSRRRFNRRHSPRLP